MIFATYWFLVFAVVVAAGWAVLPRSSWRLGWLLAGSLAFHRHFAGAAGMLPIAVIATATYLLARTRHRTACVAGIAFSAAALAFYKYARFVALDVVRPFSPAISQAALGWVDRLEPATPPLAISFFTFEFVHYLVEVHRGGQPIRHPIDFALFTVFFPSLAAGPIKRYRQFVPSLHEAAARGTASDVAAGLHRIVLGYAKKLLVADNLTGYIAARETALANVSLAGRWVFLAAIAFRILADFSGYSDIAIGCARVLGIRLPENFNWPYLATNLQDFWQRWHISLTTWIRDYIYVPLGGNRFGPARRALNAFLALALCGLWHGAAWNYVAWGLYHGVGLGISTYYERVLGPAGRGVAAVLARVPLLGWTLTTLFVWLGWLLFFYPVQHAMRIGALLVSP